MGFFDSRSSAAAEAWEREAVSSPSNVRPVSNNLHRCHVCWLTGPLSASTGTWLQCSVSGSQHGFSSAIDASQGRARSSLQAHAKTNLVYLAPTDEASKAQFIQINGM